MSRRTIRDKVKAIIEDDLSGIAKEVSIGRRAYIPRDNLPAISIYTDEEEIEVIDLSPPRTMERSLNLVLRIAVRDGMRFTWSDLDQWLDDSFFISEGNNPDDFIDAIAYILEDAITASKNLGISYVKEITPKSWTVDSDNADTDACYLFGDLTFSVIYNTVEKI